MATTSGTSIRREVVVNAPVERAFTMFTERFDAWWPKEFHIGGQAPEECVLERRDGGRWYERAADGTECEWGVVMEWQPPVRLLLAWRIDAAWRYDPEPANQTEVEVRFVADGDTRTRVELEHRLLERYGDHTEQMRGTFDSDGGWSGVLAHYSAAVEGVSA